MDITAPGKLAFFVLIVVGAFVALVTGSLSEAAFVGIVGPIAGYVVGNGVGAKRGVAQAPMFAPKPTDDPEEVGG